MISILAIFASTHAYEVALTFDDLPASGDEFPIKSRTVIAHEIMATLKKHKIVGVYGFVTGVLAKNMAERLAILEEWKKNGFLIGNHTFSHKALNSVSAPEFITDIEANEPILADFAKSIEEYKVLRFPYLEEGETQEKRYELRSYLVRRHYQIAQVTMDFEDWAFGPPFIRCAVKDDTASLKKLRDLFLDAASKRITHSLRLAEKIYGAKRIQHILLLHFSAATSEYLDSLLTQLETSGARFISLTEAMKDGIYQQDSTYTGKIGKNFIIQNRETRHLNFPSLPDLQIDREELANFCQK